jgi:hypothetical protein
MMKNISNLCISIIVFICHMGMHGTWLTPAIISNQFNDSLIARIVFGPNGTGYAVWPQATGLSVNLTPFPIFLSNYNPTTQSWTSLSELTQLGQSNYGDADPAIALDENGNGLVVWARGTGELAISNIVAMSYTNGVFSAVNNPVVLSESYSYAPQIGMAPDGDAIVTWVVANIDTYSCYIQAAYYNGTTHDWVRSTTTGLPLIKTIKDNVQFLDPYLPFPQIGIDDLHRALFVWAELGYDAASSDSYTSVVWSLSYDGSGWATWTPPAPVQLSVSNGYNPVIAMDSAGNATVAWAETAFTGYPETAPFSIKAARYVGADQDYIRQALNIVRRVLEANVYPLSFPRVQVAIDPAGNSIITWDNAINGGAIHVTRYPVDISWISWAPSIVTISQNLYVMFPTVAMDLDGNAMAVWMIYYPPCGNLLLQAAAYDQGTDSWGTPTIIVSDMNHDITYYVTEDDWPNVLFDSSGNAFVCWTQSDGRVTREYVAQYQPGVVAGPVPLLEQAPNAAVVSSKLDQIRSNMAGLKTKKGLCRAYGKPFCRAIKH